MKRATAPRPRTVIAGLPDYRPGRRGLVALASNEQPWGPLPSVARAVEAALGHGNRYPDHRAEELRSAVAERVGVSADHVAVGCGSVGLLQQLCLAFAGPHAEVAFGWPSFEAYPIFTRLTDAEGVQVPLRRSTIDTARLAASLTERTRLVLLANPNNPTGTAVRTHELLRLADSLPDECLLVVDEAYHEFATGADVPDAVTLLRDRPNVAVLRTFSKAYGLAAFRVGYLVGAPQVVAAVDKALIPFAVGRLSQAAALAALEATDELAARVATIVAERTRVVRAVRTLGISAPDPQGNFVWLPIGGAAESIAHDLECRGIVIRAFAGQGIRVTIGVPEDNDAFLTALANVWRGEAPAPALTWLDRLDIVEQRLAAHAAGPADLAARTDADAATGETWDAGQVWAHLAEFGRYWLAELDTVIDASSDEPVPFGRVKTDAARVAAIEAGRARPLGSQVKAVREAIDALRARLSEMTAADWRRRGRHSTLGDLDIAAQLEHFHVGHYEEHADQLDQLAGRSR